MSTTHERTKNPVASRKLERRIQFSQHAKLKEPGTEIAYLYRGGDVL
jgi:hypothetical protein